VEAQDDAGFWRQRAADARAAAEAMGSQTASQELLMIATVYERLADHVERATGQKSRH
jgi:hypothetical protein